MSQNKLPKQSKIIVAFVGFLVTIYLLFIGFSYLKSWNDFKPYHKLAVELNHWQGGSYKETDKKNCGLDTPNCPSIRLTKNVETNSIDSAKIIVESYNQFFMKNDYKQIIRGICDDVSGIGIYCSVSAVKDASQLRVIVNIKRDFIGIDISNE